MIQRHDQEAVDVTVYIVSRNYARYLPEAIESVLRQTMPRWELLLVDDGSKDRTPEIMSRYARLPRVRRVKARGAGLASAANAVIREARGRYLIRLDADDTFDENILLVLTHYLDQHPEAALVFPDYYLMDEHGRIFANERREQVHYRNHVQDLPPHGACTMFRMSVLEKVGGYREDLLAQDGFYIWSQIRRDHRCANVNLPLFYYRRHGNNLTDNPDRILQARRAIKRQDCRTLLEHNAPILAVIPCRSHFDAVPDLWSQDITGKTLLHLAIGKCLASDIFAKVVVTSDTPLVRGVMDDFDDTRLVYHQRTTEQTIPSRPLVDTLECLLDALGCGDEGISVLSYIQSPLTTTETLEEAVYTLLGNEADSSFTAEEITTPLFTRTPHGLAQINATGYLLSDFGRVYRELRNVFAARNAAILRGSMTGSRSVHFAVAHDECFFINSTRDIEVARAILACGPRRGNHVGEASPPESDAPSRRVEPAALETP